MEAEWDRKWMDTLKDTPLISFLNEDPVSKFCNLSVEYNPKKLALCFELFSAEEKGTLKGKQLR